MIHNNSHVPRTARRLQRLEPRPIPIYACTSSLSHTHICTHTQHTNRTHTHTNTNKTHTLSLSLFLFIAYTHTHSTQPIHYLLGTPILLARSGLRHKSALPCCCSNVPVRIATLRQHAWGGNASKRMRRPKPDTSSISNTASFNESNSHQRCGGHDSLQHLSPLHGVAHRCSLF